MEIPVLVLPQFVHDEWFYPGKTSWQKATPVRFSSPTRQVSHCWIQWLQTNLNSGKRAVSTFTTEENLQGHFLGKLEGRKRACAMCAKAGRKRKEGQGRTYKTSYACEQCGVPLCRQMRGEEIIGLHGFCCYRHVALPSLTPP